MSGAVVQDEDWDRLEHSGRFSSVMSYPFWKRTGATRPEVFQREQFVAFRALMPQDLRFCLYIWKYIWILFCSGVQTII